MMTKRSLVLSPLSSHPDRFKVAFTRGWCTRRGISPGDRSCSCTGGAAPGGATLRVSLSGWRPWESGEQCQPWEQWRLHHSSDSGSQGGVSHGRNGSQRGSRRERRPPSSAWCLAFGAQQSGIIVQGVFFYCSPLNLAKSQD